MVTLQLMNILLCSEYCKLDLHLTKSSPVLILLKSTIISSFLVFRNVDETFLF